MHEIVLRHRPCYFNKLGNERQFYVENIVLKEICQGEIRFLRRIKRGKERVRWMKVSRAKSVDVVTKALLSADHDNNRSSSHNVCHNLGSSWNIPSLSENITQSTMRQAQHTATPGIALLLGDDSLEAHMTTRRQDGSNPNLSRTPTIDRLSDASQNVNALVDSTENPPVADVGSEQRSAEEPHADLLHDAARMLLHLDSLENDPLSCIIKQIAQQAALSMLLYAELARSVSPGP